MITAILDAMSYMFAHKWQNLEVSDAWLFREDDTQIEAPVSS
jgi:hypothetical protein